MPKVKVVLFQDASSDDDYYSQQIIRQGITEWEDISEEDYQFLRNNKHRILNGRNQVERFGYGTTATIIVQDDVPVVERISTIREEIRKEQERDRKESEKRAALKAERELKKQLSKRAKTEADERRLLEELQQKYAGENKSA